MKVPWHDPFLVKNIDENWDDTPSGSGVYIIKYGKIISRAGGVDPSGILYVGKSLKLRNRLWQFWYATCHTSCSFLWKHAEISAAITG